MSAVAKMEQPGQVVPANESATILQVLSRAASDPNTDVDKMERLMAMHERMQARQAEQAFNAAMTAAQAEIGRISADATNPQTRSRYATYAKLDSVLRPVYTKHGFSLSFGTADGANEGTVRVVCDVAHADGHSRRHHADMPNDGKGAKGGDVMTKTHAQGAAMSYGMRYLLKLIFNVAVGEDDTDGNDASYDTSAWLETIAEADTPERLDKIAAEIKAKAGSIPPQPLKQIRRAWSARLSAVKGGA